MAFQCAPNAIILKLMFHMDEKIPKAIILCVHRGCSNKSQSKHYLVNLALGS